MNNKANGRRTGEAKLVSAPVPEAGQMLLIGSPRAVITLEALQTIRCFVDLMPMERPNDIPLLVK